MKNETIRKKTHDQVDKIIDGAEKINDKSNEAINHLKEKMILARKNVDNHIIEHPERSVLIAAGVGFTIGAIITILIMRKRH
jgi:ElaB/YqjD/DUF883 family membrane-anchored ribosome-binding protein